MLHLETLPRFDHVNTSFLLAETMPELPRGRRGTPCPSNTILAVDEYRLINKVNACSLAQLQTLCESAGISTEGKTMRQLYTEFVLTKAGGGLQTCPQTYSELYHFLDNVSHSDMKRQLRYTGQISKLDMLCMYAMVSTCFWGTRNYFTSNGQ